MPRESDATHAMRSALGNLWCIQEIAEEAVRLDNAKAGLAVWLRNAEDCKRWIVVVAAGGRGGDLPPHLIHNKAFFNGHDWRIP